MVHEYFSCLERSSLLDSPLVVVVKSFSGGGDLSVGVGKHCIYGKQSLDVMPNLDCKCWSMDLPREIFHILHLLF